MATMLMTRKKVRRYTWEELQAATDASNAALPAELKARHPERPFAPMFEDLATELPNRWVAVTPTRVDERDHIVVGRVLATAETKDEIDRFARDLIRQHPEVRLARFYTGRYTFGGDAVIV